MRQKAVGHFSTAAEGRTPHLRAGPLLPAEEPLIREAVANTRFDKLRAKEDAEGGFHERPEGCERFFRSGAAAAKAGSSSLASSWGALRRPLRPPCSALATG